MAGIALAGLLLATVVILSNDFEPARHILPLERCARSGLSLGCEFRLYWIQGAIRRLRPSGWPARFSSVSPDWTQHLELPA